LVLGGRHLWKDLVELHLYHFGTAQGASAQLWENLHLWLYQHVYLLIGAALAVSLLAYNRTEAGGPTGPAPRSRVVRVLSLVAAAHVVVVLAMGDAPFLYLVVAVPLLTLLAGIGYDAAIARWQTRIDLSPARARRRSQVMGAGLVLLVGATAAGWSAARSYRERLDDRHYPFWPYALEDQLEIYQRLDVAGRIARDPVMPAAGTIFGEPMIVSAVALESGARVSGELADLNPNWIVAGAITRDEVVSRIERDGVAAVITPPWFWVQDPYFRSYLSACYAPPKLFHFPDDGPGSGLPDIAVFRRTATPFPCR
jgi:hypothetical protein